MTGKIVQFIRTKDFRFIKEIGQGATGKTVLLEDEIINEIFVCKKYSPYYKEFNKVFFKNFKDEIKLLHLINHKNIVRIFNYYLYPEEHTGYILMEFIKGDDISKYLKYNPDKLDDVFRQTIKGFTHLEKINILHRDIRPTNILISEEGVVKIIDFGFSKKIDFNTDFDKSISLNWRYTQPNDFKDKIYDFKTELYFIGKLFEEIITDNNFQNFRYKNLLKKMVEKDYNQRIKSFFDLEREIISDSKNEISFTNEEKKIYRNFADKLEGIFSKIDSDATYISDISKLIRELNNIYRDSILEENIQNLSRLARSFVKGNFKYFKNTEFKVKNLNEFISLLKSSPKEKQKIIINNLWQRLDKIERNYSKPHDEPLPF